MTVREIKALVASIDPAARHYESAQRGNYTTWMEYMRTGLAADDGNPDGWKFVVERFTTQEFDPVAEAIEAGLDADDRVAFTYNVDYENDTGYIHHIFDCVGC